MQEKFVKDRDVVIFKEDSDEDTPSTVKDISAYYDSLWNYKHSEETVRKMTPRQKKKGEIFNEKVREGYGGFKEVYLKDIKKIDWYESTVETESIRLVHNPLGRLNQDPLCLKEILRLASQAEESIFLQSPYIIPSRQMQPHGQLYSFLVYVLVI